MQGSLPPSRRRAAFIEGAERLARQPHLVAVRDGVIGALPMVLVGSLFLLVAQPPSQALQALVAEGAEKLLLPYRMLGGLIALYVCFGTARSLARHHGLDDLGASLTAVASFFTAQAPAPLAEGGWGLAAANLGSGGMFGAIVVALLSVEVQRFFLRRGWAFRLPPSVPESIGKSFLTVVPAFVSVTLAWAVVHVAGLDLLTFVARALQPMVQASDSLPGVWLLCLMDSVLWLVGIHPIAVLGAMKPVWLSMLAENMAAAADGRPLPFVATREFFLWFVWQGGSGGTLGATLLLLRARSGGLRAVGRLALVPSIFNVNEPILFGLPVVMNPRLAVPFVLGPLVSCTTTWLAMSEGWVAQPRLEVLWTLPAPLGAYLATGGDLGAFLLQTTNLLLSMGLWWPFLRSWDRKMLRSSAEAPAEARDAAVMPGPAARGA